MQVLNCTIHSFPTMTCFFLVPVWITPNMGCPKKDIPEPQLNAPHDLRTTCLFSSGYPIIFQASVLGAILVLLADVRVEVSERKTTPFFATLINPEKSNFVETHHHSRKKEKKKNKTISMIL